MKKTIFLTLLTPLLIFLSLPLLSPAPALAAVPSSGLPTPQPGSEDRLAIPILPENPSQIEIGQSVYYYNCMPCHGDQGQGLTDEFRQIWEEDHQNCWERGCHGGRRDDEGFPIPRQVPSVSNQGALFTHFATQEALFNYLNATHPPQRPGVLPKADVRAVTAFIFHSNGVDIPQNNLQDQGWIGLAAFALILPLCAGALILQARPRKDQVLSSSSPEANR